MAELFEEQSDSSEDEAKTRADKQLCYWKSRIRCSDADRSSASSSATCAGHRTHFANAATASLQRQTRGNEMDAQEMLELHLSQFRAATNVALTTEKHFEEYQRHLIAEIEHRMHEPSSHWANDDGNSLRSSGCTGTLLDTERTHSLTQLSSAASEPSFAWRCLQRVMRDMYSTDVRMDCTNDTMILMVFYEWMRLTQLDKHHRGMALLGRGPTRCRQQLTHPRTNVVSADMHLDDTVGSLVIPSCNTQQLSGSGYMVHHSLISTMATMAKLKHLNNLLVSMRTRCDAH